MTRWRGVSEKLFLSALVAQKHQTASSLHHIDACKPVLLAVCVGCSLVFLLLSFPGPAAHCVCLLYLYMFYVSLLQGYVGKLFAHVYLGVFGKAANRPKDTGKGERLVNKEINFKKVGSREHSIKKRWLNNLLSAAFKCNIEIPEASRWL